MATSYPGGIDAFTNPTSGDDLDTAGVVHSVQHANLNDAVEAIEAELGTNPSGAAATVAARFTAVESDVAALAPDASVFHVDSYGAVGDGTTDDTTAIRDAIAAAEAAGGGIVQFGAKTYLCNGPLVTSEGGYAVLPLPTGVPLHLRGVQPANNCDPRTSTGYTVIKTTKTGLTRSGTYGVPSLIGGPTDSTWAETTVSIEDLCLWLPANPTIAGIDLWHVRRCVVDGVNVQAINTGDADYTQPTSVHAFAIRTPEAQNYNAVLIRNGQAHGTYAGLVGSVESLTVDYWVSKWCVVGWGPTPGGHGAAVLKMSLEWCKYHVSGWSETAGAGSVPDGGSGTTTAQVSVTELAIEDAPSGWYATTAHINDSTNRIKGVVYFDRWDGSGVSSTLTKTGGTGLTAIALLSPSFGSGSALTVQDENANVSTAVTQIDFQGSGVTTTTGTGEVIVTIPGASASTVYTKRDRLTATAGQDTLTLGDTPVTDSLFVWVDNVIKWPVVDYVRTGAVIVFGAALTAGQVVLSAYQTTNASAGDAALSSGTVIPTYPAAIAALTPLAYWKQDDPHTAISDSSGNARTLSPAGTLTYAQASLLAKGTGTSILFGGGNAAMASAAWMETDYVSVVMRYKPRAADVTAGLHGIISRWLDAFSGSTPSNYCWLLAVKDGKVAMQVHNNTGTELAALSGATTLVADTTYTIGMSWDGTTARVYVNGAVDASASYAGVLRKGSGSAISLAQIAGSNAGGGTFDELALFDAGLTPTDMANLHTAAITP